MLKTSHTILVVDEAPHYPNLIKAIGNFDYDIKLERAISPNNAIELLNKIASPSLVWSNNEFKSSNIDGKSLLKYFSQNSPLSSRILCGSNLSKVEMDLMVSSGQVHSYFISNSVRVLNPILSRIKLGVEFHKVNLVGDLIDRLDFESIPILNKAHIDFLNFEKKIGWEFQGTRDWVDIKNQSFELEKLSHYTQAVSKKISTKTSDLSKTLATLKGKKDNERQTELIKHIEHKLASIDKFLIHSEKHLKQSLAHVTQTKNQIAKTKDEIKRLKDEFIGE
jgi:hypothetical protein